MSDAAIIDRAVTAHQAGYVISDGQARVIAAAWHGGATSALCSLATTGAIHLATFDEIEWEIKANADAPEAAELSALLGYCQRVGLRKPVPGWDSLWG